MIVRKEYIKHEKGGFAVWYVTKYLLFGFIPIYINRFKVR